MSDLWKLSALPVSLAIFVLLSSTPAINSPQRDYTDADMPKLMEATWNEDVLGGGVDAATVESLLRRGQLIIVNERVKKLKWLVTCGVLANASPETILKAYTDYPNYGKIMPETESASSVPRGQKAYDLTVNHRVKLAKGLEIPASYTITMYFRSPLRADWVKSAGDFEENSGYFQLVPVNGGKQTMIFFTAYTLPRMPIITNFIKNDPDLDIGINMSVAIMFTRGLKRYSERADNREPFVPGKDAVGSVADVVSKNPETVDLLTKRGGLLLIEDGPPKSATTAIVIDAPPPDVFQLATSFQKYPCIQPETKRADVIEKSARSAKIRFNMEINPVIFSINLKYTLAYAINPPTGLTWKWAEGDVPSQAGSWNFLPLDGGKKTLAIFGISEDLRTLPGVGGMGVRSAINLEPAFEPSVLASQTMILARGIRATANLPPSIRNEKLSHCP